MSRLPMPSHDGALSASRPKPGPSGMQLGVNPSSTGLVDYTPASLEDDLRLNKIMSGSFDATQLHSNRRGHSNDVRAEAALCLAETGSGMPGRATGADSVAVKHSGFTEGQALELVLLAALNFLIHLVDDVGMTDSDFPGVTAGAN